MQDIFAESECPFIVIIDEWDCIFREFKHDKAAQEIYLDFLRDLLKDKRIHLSCLYDGNFANKEIRNPQCTEYVR